MRKKEIEAAVTSHEDWMRRLAAAHQRTEAQIAETNKTLKELGEATDRRFQETDQRFRETDHRIREIGERIDDLVSAIGDLISRIPPGNLKGNGQDGRKNGGEEKK